MKSLTFVPALLTSAAALNVVKFDIRRSNAPSYRLLRRDPSAFEAGLDNLISQYQINITIGTPPQPFSLQLDTGSSDLWVNTAGSAYCQAGNCTGGVFNTSASSTFNDTYPGQFAVGYADTTQASGDFAQDVVSFGGITLENQLFGVANVSNISAGLMGVAFAHNEGICNNNPNAICHPYPTTIDNLVLQGKINSRAYSLWLDDLASSTGSILFGGIDTSKYHGDLTVLDIIPDSSSTANSTIYKNFDVAWTNFSFSGSDYGFSDNSNVATLDSGTTLTYLPTDAYNAIAAALNITADGLLDCSLAQTDMTLDFKFGGPDGVVISCDISEFVVDNLPAGTKLDNGARACSAGVGNGTVGAGDTSYLVGDTFLRSAYVVYDLENTQIGIAATNFSPGDENIVEIDAAGDIPGASTTLTYMPPAATSAAANQSAIGPVTATYTPSGSVAPMPTYHGAAGSLTAGLRTVLGVVAGAVLLSLL